ncbi:hypothetical protein SmJEL517_g04295 [Synchytrium microbalum]|uniref:Ribonucleases P/MRP subunit Pop8-like domain-containing protein n=1 Tax=Synchytrium microbalum TaxID=1806994 RepID=A0A507BUJ0_9FUNG|nr:uncharacterized protein SmJEL517_g04295 [Synchytrium microbalum]TPX32617.1 hypothetical protein SmJEL517_g04295 [Synchytrium microbalum]
MATERIILNTPKWYYLSVSLISDPPHPLDELYFRNAMSMALREAFGISGMSTPLDLLRFDHQAQHAFIRIPQVYLIQVQSALTLLHSLDDRTCRFHVHQVSAHLMSLAVDNRVIRV